MRKRQIEFYAQAEVATLRTLGIVSCLSQACHWRSDVTSVIQSVICAVLPSPIDELIRILHISLHLREIWCITSDSCVLLAIQNGEKSCYLETNELDPLHLRTFCQPVTRLFLSWGYAP
jgi:hypothetical protein